MTRSSSRPQSVVVIAAVAAWLHPILHLMSLYAAWGIHWAILGHNPRVRMPGDSELYASVWLRLSDSLVGLLFMMVPVAFFVGGLLTLWVTLARIDSVFQILGIYISFIALWAAWYLYLGFDPGGVLEWWWD